MPFGSTTGNKNQVQHIYEPIPEDIDFYEKKFAEYDKIWKFMQAYYEQ